MTREIVLSNGMVTLVDDADFDWLNSMKWQYTSGYVAHAFRKGTQRGTVYMHRLIMAADSCIEVDHENHNKLDNQRGNLRLATGSQNCMNRLKRSGNCTSKYKGVSWHPKSARWQVVIVANGVRTHLRTYADEVEAAKAYDAAALDLHGPYALLNFPQEAS